MKLLHFRAQRESIRRFHHHVGDQQIHTIQRRRMLVRLLRAGRDPHFVAGHRFHHCHERLENARLVINNQDSHDLIFIRKV